MFLSLLFPPLLTSSFIKGVIKQKISVWRLQPGHVATLGNLNCERKSTQENGRNIFEVCYSVDVLELAGCTATAPKITFSKFKQD